jgi:hypothetical protein
MINIDKFGRTIYPGVFSKMNEIGHELEGLGYSESFKKPNLFWKSFGKEFTAFADMRGTAMIPIWEDPTPLLYIQSKQNAPPWLCRKFFHIVTKELGSQRIPYRESYELLVEGESHLDDEQPHGFCRWCGGELFSGSLFCDTQCENAFMEMEKKIVSNIEKYRFERSKRSQARQVQELPTCEICGRRTISENDDGELEKVLNWHFPKTREHHSSYSPEITIIVCPSCHASIHNSKPGGALYRFNPARLGQNRKMNSGKNVFDVAEQEGR